MIPLEIAAEIVHYLLSFLTIADRNYHSSQ